MIPWFKKHPEYLQREVEVLGRDSNYRQLDIFRGNLLVSQGYIRVCLDKVHLFPFLIIYPNAVPFALPMFFPLKAPLPTEQVEAFSRMLEEEAITKVKKHVKYFYHLRHQNSSGVLCTMDWQALENGPSFTGIKTLLKRVTDWCRGTITGVFPPDSEEVEFHAHFTDTIYDLHFIYPQYFLDTSMDQGEAFAILASRVRGTPPFIKTHSSYLGQLIFGTGEKGIFSASRQDYPQILIDAGISNELDIAIKSTVLEELLQKNDNLIRIFWFHLSDEPEPFYTIIDLVLLIGDGDQTKGAARMARICIPYLNTKPDEFYVGIRFAGRKGTLEFQLFKIFKGTNASPVLFSATPGENLLSILDDYKRVAAVPSAKYSDESFHLRNQGRADRSVLKDKKINFIGTGAIGSEVSDIFAKAGVGHILLIDNQRMRLENSVRHLVGLDKVGFAKVEAVKSVILEHNPFVSVTSYAANITQISLGEFEQDSFSISSIAEDNTEAFLNERAVIMGHTIYYIRALRGGKVGRIFRVIPGQDACLRCLELYRQEKKEFISVDEDLSLPTLFTECNNPVRPASAADLKLIAALASRLILNELEHGTAENNHWIWSTEELPGLSAYQLKTQIIPVHPKCLYCHHDQKIKVFIDQKCLEIMQGLVKATPGVETGGILAGYADQYGNVFITDASGPGPHAKQSSIGFEKDVVYCQAFLDHLFTETKGKAQYIGEWHSHPNENNSPSGRDIQSLSEIAFQPNYLTEKPVMIIFSSSGRPSTTVHPMAKGFYTTTLEILDDK